VEEMEKETSGFADFEINAIRGPFWTINERPLQNALFCPVSVSGSNFNPQNTPCIPVVKIFAFLELEQS
jgi:hypothetical protein